MKKTKTHRWYEKSVSSHQLYTATWFYHFTKESVGLFSWQNPFLIMSQILISWGNKKENFLSLQNMVPNWGTTQIDMKIRPTPLDTHQTIFLNFWIHHIFNTVWSFNLHFLQMARPNFINPINLSNYSWGCYLIVEFGIGEFQADNVAG